MEKDNVRQAYFESSNGYGLESGSVCKKNLEKHVNFRTTCSYCEGTKIFIKYKCLECEGIGRKTYDAPLDLVIPPGKILNYGRHP